MEFLAVVVALTVVYLHGPVQALQFDQRYLHWLTNIKTEPGVAGFMLKLLLPVIATVMMLNLLALQAPFLVFFFNLAILFLCFGRWNIETKIDVLITDFEHGDSQAVFHELEELDHENLTGDLTTKAEFKRVLLELVSYRLFEYVFPVLFWFLIFGAPGAVLYRSAIVLADSTDEDQDLLLSNCILRALEWLPVRLLGLIFCVVGNFSSCFQRWRVSVFDTRLSSAKVIAQYVEGAIVIDQETITLEEGAAEMESVKDLFHRALIFSLSIFAILEMW